MYDVKDLINRMKTIADIDSNVKLANLLNVSYNTFNTWLKRHKLPQEVLYNFCIKYNCSFDYLFIGNQDNHNLFDNTNINNYQKDEEIVKYTFFGQCNSLNITSGQVLELNTTLLHSSAYYLLQLNSVYFIAKVYINPFDNIALIKTDNYSKNLSIEEFNKIKIGLIVRYL